MNLAVFDIDGTLTASFALDEACFVQAFADVFGLTGINTDWASYPHVTDESMARVILREHLGRPATPAEVGAVKTRFLTLLREAGEPIPPIPGASAFVQRLRDDPGWAVALATGSWAASAQFKLASAGLPVAGLPLATSDDALSRGEIVRHACALAEAQGGQTFAKIVCLGDGVWDVRTAHALGYPCIGIGTGAQAERLRAARAAAVLADYGDSDAAFEALQAV